MKLPASIFGLALAAILLVIAVPYGLVQLDWIPASSLRVVPSVAAIVLALAFAAAALSSFRRKKK